MQLFAKNGWCFTSGGIPSGEWGFCDTSCNSMRDSMIGDSTVPDIYHKMVWEVDRKDPLGCIKDWKDTDKKGFLCVKSLYPTVPVPQFKLNEQRNLEHYINNQEEPGKDYYIQGKWGTQQMCLGDSGAGNWVFDPKIERASMVGVQAQSLGFCSSPSLVTDITSTDFINWIKKHANIKPAV